MRSVLTRDIAADCHLRLLERADARELYALVDAERERLARWMPWATGQTLELTEQFVGQTRRQLADDDGMALAIVRGGAIAGVVSYHRVSWMHAATSVGYWLGSQHEGRGIMTAAVRALVDHAFDGWCLRRVEIRAATENARSRAIALRLGFVEEGVLRAAERVGDRWYDLVVYGMLAADWSPAA